MWMRCSYLIIEVIRYFPFVFYLALNFSYNCYANHQCRWFSLTLLKFCSKKPYSAGRMPASIIAYSTRNSARRICLNLMLVCAVCPSNPIGSPGRRLETLNTEPSLIVNLKQPRKSQLFSVRLWSRSVIYKVQCESNTRKLLLYHLRTWCLHVAWTKLNECDDLCLSVRLTSTHLDFESVT